MCAKPVIDLVLRLPYMCAVVNATKALTDAGWTAPIVVGDPWAPSYPQTGRRAAIGHISTAEQWPSAHVRLFAGWVRSHAEDRQRYARLKQGLVADGIWDASTPVARISSCARSSTMRVESADCHQLTARSNQAHTGTVGPSRRNGCALSGDEYALGCRGRPCRDMSSSREDGVFIWTFRLVSAC
jgi:GrpB protein